MMAAPPIEPRSDRAEAATSLGAQPRRLLAALIRAYQRFLSPTLPPSCRFHPSCSEYAIIAIRRFGAAKGSWLALRRIARCHPLNPGGIDEVPER